MLRKTTLAATIAATLAIVSGTTAASDETFTTGTVQHIVNGQVVKTIHTYGIGEMPSSSAVSPIHHNTSGVVHEAYIQLDAKGVTKITLDKDHFLSKKVGDKTTLSLIDEDVEYTTESVVTDTNGVVTWIGNTIDGDGAIISMGKDGYAYGSVYTDEDTYSIETQENESLPPDVWLVSTQKSGVKMPTVEGDTEQVSHQAALSDERLIGVKPDGTIIKLVNGVRIEFKPPVTPDANTPIVIDLLYAYSTTYKTKIDTFIASLTPAITKAFKDSGMANVSFKSAGKIEVPYADTEPTSGVPSKMQQGLGIWAPVKDMRAKVKADLVVFVRPFKVSQTICGQALLNGGNQSAINANVANAVVGAGSDGAYGCYGDTMIHEVGHIMGVVHNRETMDEFGMSAVKGRYEDSYGFAYGYKLGYGGSNCSAGDVMSYCFNRKMKYSNPDVIAFTVNGVSTSLGVTGYIDAVRTLKEMAPKVATFR